MSIQNKKQNYFYVVFFTDQWWALVDTVMNLQVP